MQQPLDKIILNGMEFYGYHGVLPGEQELGQRFIVDVEISCHLNFPARLDELEETIDYQEVFELVRGIVQEERYNLIEALAERIAQAVLGKYTAEEVLVRVKKPHAPLGGIFSYVGVEVRRGRTRAR
ncbi:MAG: dihydroneopterin aldolase [Firmicutes bacterium]|nr:dihydroneopterin aldolase [Bacillota bacterium]